MTGCHGKVYDIDWNPCSTINLSQIASISIDHRLRVFNIRQQSVSTQHNIVLKNPWAMTCRFSPNGFLVATGGLDNTCTIWQVADSQSYALNKGT